MCQLIKAGSQPMTAEEPITVYKAGMHVKDGSLRTYWMAFEMVEGSSHRIDSNGDAFRTAIKNAKDSMHCPNMQILDAGGFHSCTNKKDSINMILNTHRPTGEISVMECVIPKGSLYIRGVWGNDYITESIFSDSITFVKILPWTMTT